MTDEKEIIGKEAVKYGLLDDLTKQEGWPILLEQLEKFKVVASQALLFEKDYNKILALQGQIIAFGSVIKILESAKSIREKLFKDITDIIEDERLKKEFDI